METQEAPKRKYQKHKKGFKISVEHKLYVKGREAEYEPLYIEIRAKNQNTLVRSRFHCCINPKDFDKLFKNGIISECLELEKSLIISSINQEVEQMGQEFSMKEWYRKYSNSLDRKYLADVYIDYVRRLFVKAAYEKEVDEALVLRAIDDSDDEWEVVTFMRLLCAFGFKEFEEPLELRNRIADFQNYSVSFAIHQQVFTGVGYFSITDSIVGSDLTNGLFAKILMYHADSEENNSKFLHNALAIEEMLREK